MKFQEKLPTEIDEKLKKKAFLAVFVFVCLCLSPVIPSGVSFDREAFDKPYGCIGIGSLCLNVVSRAPKVGC